MTLSAEQLNPHVWTEAVARDYDRSSASMYAPDVLDPAVQFLTDHAAGGRVAEFAIGTGRVALPLAAQGLDVAGIEFSTAMVEELRHKDGGADLQVAIGDMATTRLPGEFSLVFLAYNAITCLLTQAAQLQCFENAASHLSPGGALVMEVFVPQLGGLLPGEVYKPFHISEDHLAFDEYDTVNQLVVSHHFDFFHGVDGATRFDSPHRYAWPSELDLMAQHAGLDFEERSADWSGVAFTADSESHVSVWRKPLR